MRTAPLVALGIVAYTIFVVATVPASFVAARVENRLRESVRIHEAHGTVWHGAARAEVAVPIGWLPIDSLAWRVQPAELLRGRIAFALDAQAAGLAAQGRIARGLASWHASGQANGDASFFTALSPLAGTWRPEGSLALSTDDFSWDEREARGTVQADWREAAVALSQVRPLGTYRATLRAEGATGKIDLATVDGPLRITGRGDLAFPSRFTFNGEARAQGPQAASLDPLLELLGPRRPDGARTLAWRSS